jgi:L-serine dehydratase
MGPWRAAQRFLGACQQAGLWDSLTGVEVELYGSLAKTGKGHGTDIAVLMGLQDADPTTCDTQRIPHQIEQIHQTHQLALGGQKPIRFDPAQHLIFHYQEALPFHPNGLRFNGLVGPEVGLSNTYYSVGGGFVVEEGQSDSATTVTLPYPCDSAREIAAHCQRDGLAIWQMVWQNEHAWRTSEAIQSDLWALWQTMLACMYRGCHAQGELPGGLHVVRRAAQFHTKLIGQAGYDDPASWLKAIQGGHYSFSQMIRWVSCFALAVNEENAAFGRVVTAPTNGAAGVLPAVLMYYVCSEQPSDFEIMRFLMVAGEVGTLFKKGATISAALGGCQAEIGVSSAMAAAALAEAHGANPEQALMAAEIAMEHHLGLTCDPIGGLVQIPCIERNAMGAMKAITAAQIALESSPQQAKVSLDAVIKTMWETAQDMHIKYKETSEGGLALQIPVNVIEC